MNAVLGYPVSAIAGSNGHLRLIKLQGTLISVAVIRVNLQCDYCCCLSFTHTVAGGHHPITSLHQALLHGKPVGCCKSSSYNTFPREFNNMLSLHRSGAFNPLLTHNPRSTIWWHRGTSSMLLGQVLWKCFHWDLSWITKNVCGCGEDGSKKIKCFPSLIATNSSMDAPR